MSMYSWTKVVRAEIDDALRTSLEQYGERVVAQMIAVPMDQANRGGFPNWFYQRSKVLSWLREKHLEEERRRDINETMELAIIALVAIEAVLSVLNWKRHW